MERWFGPADNFTEFVRKSQQTQALGYKMAIEAHRLAEQCDGTLFWQLNDCWPGPSWSVIDFSGRPKLAYSVVKDRYQPMVIIPQRQEDEVNIFVLTEDQNQDSAQLLIELLNHNGTRVWSVRKTLALRGKTKHLVYRSHKNKILDGFSPAEATLKITLSRGDEIRDIEYLYFTTPVKYLGAVDLVGLQ